jgi:hypothetical protein
MFLTFLIQKGFLNTKQQDKVFFLCTCHASQETSSTVFWGRQQCSNIFNLVSGCTDTKKNSTFEISRFPTLLSRISHVHVTRWMQMSPTLQLSLILILNPAKNKSGTFILDLNSFLVSRMISSADETWQDSHMMCVFNSDGKKLAAAVWGYFSITSHIIRYFHEHWVIPGWSGSNNGHLTFGVLLE